MHHMHRDMSPSTNSTRRKDFYKDGASTLNSRLWGLEHGDGVAVWHGINVATCRGTSLMRNTYPPRITLGP